jgi:hypothetical protein
MYVRQACCAEETLTPAAWPTDGGRQRTAGGVDIASVVPLAFLPLPPLEAIEATWHRICDSLSHAT